MRASQPSGAQHQLACRLIKYTKRDQKSEYSNRREQELAGETRQVADGRQVGGRRLSAGGRAAGGRQVIEKKMEGR